jgi:hypothetical protein
VLLGNAFKKSSSLIQAGFAKGVEGCPSQATRVVHIGGRATHKDWVKVAAICRVPGAHCGPLTPHCSITDEHIASQLHRRVSCSG